MRTTSYTLEQALFKAVSDIQHQIKGNHIVWDIDRHDRFIIEELHFGASADRAGYIAAIGAMLDTMSLKGGIDLTNARAEVVDVFTSNGFVDGGDGLFIRNGLSLRDEAKEKIVFRKVAEVDRSFMDVYCEWKFASDGHLVIEHLETAHEDQRRRDAYLGAFNEILDEAEVDCVAVISEINFRAEYAGLFEVMGYEVDFAEGKATRFHGQSLQPTI